MLLKVFTFTSKREQWLWAMAFLVCCVIYTSLFFGGIVLDFVAERQLMDQISFYVFLIIILTFICSGLKFTHRKLQYWIYAGVLSVCAMAILRLDFSIPERSHIFEYGLLSILINEALTERQFKRFNAISIAIIAALIAGTIGLIDESIQYVIPYRVFDSADIIFNYSVCFFGVALSLTVRTLQHFIIKKRTSKRL